MELIVRGGAYFKGWSINPLLKSWFSLTVLIVSSNLCHSSATQAVFDQRPGFLKVLFTSFGILHLAIAFPICRNRATLNYNDIVVKKGNSSFICL